LHEQQKRVETSGAPHAAWLLPAHKEAATPPTYTPSGVVHGSSVHPTPFSPPPPAFHSQGGKQSLAPTSLPTWECTDQNAEDREQSEEEILGLNDITLTSKFNSCSNQVFNPGGEEATIASTSQTNLASNEFYTLTSYLDAMATPQVAKWKKVMDIKINNLH
jgi:hypothetical protein